MFLCGKHSAMPPKPASAKHIKVLEGLLKLPENKECADCKSKAPRWASINIGIFICLQCSGIHRSLGVHISKVRSATLDTWLPEQVVFMQSMGNKKSNAHWEAELPLHYDRGRIENFIHAKYVEKRWIPTDCNIKTPSNSKQELAPSRSTKRFGGIAEWTNNQHLCKGRRDGSTGERNRAALSSGIGEECSGSKNEHQKQEKKENCQPSMNQSASIVKIFNGEPSEESAQVASSVLHSGSVQKPEQEVLKIKSATTKVMTAVTSPEVNRAAEQFVSLCMDDSSDNGSSLPETSAWVHFDSDQESSTPEAKIVPNPTIAKGLVQEAKLTIKSSSSKVNPVPTMEGAQTATVPLANGHFGGHQKYVTNDNQSLLEKPNMVSSSSVHLQRLALLAQGLSSTYAPTSAGSIHHLNVNGGSVEHSSGTQMPMQTFQPMKLASDSVRYTNTMSSLYTPAMPLRSMSTTSARMAPAAFPVSGYDYDFSFLTQGMFTTR